MRMIDPVDLLISLSFFSISVEMWVSLWHYRRVTSGLGKTSAVLCGLFGLIFLSCGMGHLLRALDLPDYHMGIITCIVSLVTSLCLILLVPSWIRQSKMYPSIDELVQLNEETASSKRKLFTFMNFLCHEIRNPLFAITSNIEFAQDVPMPEDVQESLSAINQSASLMLRLVNDVLDLSKIESGKLELEKQEFDLQDFFQNMASSMSRQVLAKSQGAVQFIFHMSPDIPRIVQTDSVRLLQICYNILSNASKFTELGSITFSVDVHEESAPMDNSNPSKVIHGSARERSQTSGLISMDGMASLDNFSFSVFKKKDSESGMTKSSHKHSAALTGSQKSYASQEPEHKVPDQQVVMIRLVFEDTGIGIEEAHLERIFQPYTQSKLSDFRRHGGTGLGLSIIYKLLSMMEGSVQVTSAVGEGTKFTIHLPVVVPHHISDAGEGDIENQQRDKPNPSIPEEVGHRGSYAKLDEMKLALDAVSEEGDLITPLSSVSSLECSNLRRVNPNSPVHVGAVTLGTLAPERKDAATPLSQNRGALRLGGLPPERDDVATPLTRNISDRQCRAPVEQVNSEAIPWTHDHLYESHHNSQVPDDRPDDQYHYEQPQRFYEQPQYFQPSYHGGPHLQGHTLHHPDMHPRYTIVHHPGMMPAFPKHIDPRIVVLGVHPEQQLFTMHHDSQTQIESSPTPYQPLFATTPMSNNVQPQGPLLTPDKVEPSTAPKPVLEIVPAEKQKPPEMAQTGKSEDPSLSLESSLLPLLPESVQACKARRLHLPPSASSASECICMNPEEDRPMPSSPAKLESQNDAESIKAEIVQKNPAPSPRGAPPPSAFPAGVAPQRLFGLNPMSVKPFTAPTMPANRASQQMQQVVPQQVAVEQAPLPHSAPIRGQPTHMAANQSQVRQLSKFNFPKNTNMVLVVDDNGINRKLIGKMLSYFNLEYLDAEHGKQAVEIMERSQNCSGNPSAPLFGMVIMDLCMPIMNGYEATEAIRKKLNLDIPIITLTASAMEDEKRKALEAGATEFATKPLLRAALHKKCEEYLRPLGE